MTEITNCRLWAEDVNGNRIAGDGKGHYHECSTHTIEIIGTESYDWYWIHAKVETSRHNGVYVGGFNSDTCLEIHGSTGDWKLSVRNMSDCNE